MVYGSGDPHAAPSPLCRARCFKKSLPRSRCAPRLSYFSLRIKNIYLDFLARSQLILHNISNFRAEFYRQDSIRSLHAQRDAAKLASLPSNNLFINPCRIDEPSKSKRAASSLAPSQNERGVGEASVGIRGRDSDEGSRQAQPAFRSYLRSSFASSRDTTLCIIE